MSDTTVLELVQTAAVEMGIRPPVSAFNSADIQAYQLGALLNATGAMLVKRQQWRQLWTEATITTVDGQATYDLPPDYARPISQTEWDRTNRWPMIGPETSQQWQWLKSGILSTGPRERFRLVGNKIEVWPVPGPGSLPTPLTLSYYYVSKWWVVDPDGARIIKANDDNDTCVFDDRLMISGIKLRFFQTKGLDTTAFAADFQNNLDDAIAQDLGAQVLSLSKQPAFPLITIYNLPDGNWSGPGF